MEQTLLSPHASNQSTNVNVYRRGSNSDESGQLRRSHPPPSNRSLSITQEDFDRGRTPSSRIHDSVHSTPQEANGFVSPEAVNQSTLDDLFSAATPIAYTTAIHCPTKPANNHSSNLVEGANATAGIAAVSTGSWGPYVDDSVTSKPNNDTWPSSPVQERTSENLTFASTRTLNAMTPPSSYNAHEPPPQTAPHYSTQNSNFDGGYAQTRGNSNGTESRAYGIDAQEDSMGGGGGSYRTEQIRPNYPSDYPPPRSLLPTAQFNSTEPQQLSNELVREHAQTGLPAHLYPGTSSGRSLSNPVDAHPTSFSQSVAYDRPEDLSYMPPNRSYEVRSEEFTDDRHDGLEKQLFGPQLNFGINFSAYNTIPVNISGRNPPKPILEVFVFVVGICGTILSSTLCVLS